MKPVNFEYERPQDLESAINALSSGGEGCRIISGGQSLGPMMNLRLARPKRLIDVSALGALREINETRDSVFIGAAVTHVEIEDGGAPDPLNGMLSFVAGGIAYRAVRNKGTIGGSVAHADPAADWITFLTAAAASVHIAGPKDARTVPIQRFMLGAYTTALAKDEIITRIEIPKHSKSARWGYYKICRKVGDFADAIGAAVIDPERRRCRIVLGAVGAAPVILTNAAAELARTAALPASGLIHAEIGNTLSNINPVSRRLLGAAAERAVMQAVGP